MSEVFKHQAVKGVVWSAIERFSVQGIQFVLSLVIARLVSPSDFGLIAMLGIFMAVAQTFVDSGFSNALIQKKDRTEADFSTIFYFNILVAVFVYGILYMSAPYISHFYNEPLLKDICRWSGINIILNSLVLIQRTRLIISLDFRGLAKVSLFSVIISGLIGIWLAWLGYGVWALVVQTLCTSFFYVILLWVSGSWIPKRVFSLQSFNELFSFGSKLLLGGLLHTIYMNLYTLVIGRFFNSMQVGYFSRAQTLAVFPSMNFTEVVNRAMYPVLCEQQDSEEKLVDIFLKYLRITVFCVFPLMIGLAILSEPLIKVLLTDKWIPSAHLLSILCIAYMWYPIMVFNWQLLNVKGRSDLSLRAEMIKKIIAFLILFISIIGGIDVICWGLLLYSLSDMIIIYFFIKKIYVFDFSKEIRLLLPVLFCSLLMGVCIFFCNYLLSNPFLQLIAGFVVGSISYLGFCLIFRLKEIDIIRQRIKRE